MTSRRCLLAYDRSICLSPVYANRLRSLSETLSCGQSLPATFQKAEDWFPKCGQSRSIIPEPILSERRGKQSSFKLRDYFEWSCLFHDRKS